MGEMFRVLVVEGCEPLRNGLCRDLSQLPDIEIVGAAASGMRALELIAETKPDLVLLDCRLPDFCGQEVVVLAQEHGFLGQFLPYSAYSDFETVSDMVALGAAGYVLNEEPTAQLIEAILTVARGGQWYSQRLAPLLADMARASTEKKEELTAREVQVAELLLQGLTNQQMANKLDITERGVRHHVSNIYSKIGVENRKQAIVYGLQKGLPTRRVREKIQKRLTDPK